MRVNVLEYYKLRGIVVICTDEGEYKFLADCNLIIDHAIYAVFK